MAKATKVGGYTMLSADDSQMPTIPSPSAIASSRFQSNLQTLRQGPALPEPNAEPPDFQAALTARRQAMEDAQLAQGTNAPSPRPRRWAGNPVVGGVYAVHDRIAGLPKPTGLGALVVLLIILVMIIIPIAGHDTRMSLLWKTLIGQKRLTGEAGTTQQPPAVPSGPVQAGLDVLKVEQQLAAQLAQKEIGLAQGVASAVTGGVGSGPFSGNVPLVPMDTIPFYGGANGYH